MAKCIGLVGVVLVCGIAFGGNNTDAYKQEAIEWARLNENALDKIALAIWNYAEPAFTEYKSSKILSDKLRKNGFKIESPVGDELTAFVAVANTLGPSVFLKYSDKFMIYTSQS